MTFYQHSSALSFSDVVSANISYTWSSSIWIFERWN